MKDIPCFKGAKLIRGLVEQGEHVHQDFKYMISDARKIARSVSAFANNSGGRLLIGVKDNGVIAGVRNEEDVYVVEQAATRYCDPAQEVEFKSYSIDTGVTVIVASIPTASSRPVRVVEADGSRRAYFRIADENIVAHPLMERAWERRESSAGTLIHGLSDNAKRLLGLLEGGGEAGLTDREIALGLHLSERLVGSMIVDMAAVGVVDFRYDGHCFRIVIPDEEEPDDGAF